MHDSATIEWLAEAIGQATKTARFCVTGCLTDVDPDLEIEGVGAVRLPLKRGIAKQLIGVCQVAPYGKGTQTLVNAKVRNTFELDPKHFRLGDAWNSAVACATQTVAEQLGLPGSRLEARLYKLLVYEKGGFFLPHRDSEKHNRMADPANKVGRIAAREDMRQHLISMINRHQCDVEHALERKGSPFSLVLTKTTGSFERAVKQYETDCLLLSELPLEP